MPQISILAFADSVLGIQPYKWQSRILLRYEAGDRVAAACAITRARQVVGFSHCCAVEALGLSEKSSSVHNGEWRSV